MVLTVEIVASRFHFDEFADEDFAWDVAENDVLWIIIQDDKLVGYPRRRLRLLLLELRLHLLHLLAQEELLVLRHFPQRAIARCDVALDDLLQVLVVFVADAQA